MANRIISNETSYHGAGSRSVIAIEIKRRHLKNDIPELAVVAFNDVCTSGNPRLTSVKEIVEPYKQTF